MAVVDLQSCFLSHSPQEVSKNVRVLPFVIIMSFKHACEPTAEASRRDTALANGCEQDGSSWLFSLLHHPHASHLFGEFTG